jgi:cytochrome bd ubiquinol oxidase subunit II
MMNDFVRELSALPLSVLVTLGLLFVALVLYAVLGGADYGGGVWDLLASGPRTQEQRRLIESAIGPVWEANHVWLIFMIVLLFTAFPPAFAVLSTALHIPLTLMLLGIVLRGTSFTFRQYDRQDDPVQQRWGRLFAISSVFTPVMLGICIGAISTGGIRVKNGVVTSGFLRPWLGLFPFAVGLFAVVLFAFLAAVYLTLEAEDEALREDFRRRALGSAGAVGALALGVYLLSHEAAPLVRAGLTQRPWSWLLQIVTGVFAVGAIAALWRRRFHLARVLAVGQVTLILTGWALAQYPLLVPPDISITQAAAPVSVLRPLLGGTAIGLLILVPSFLYLFRVFKGGTAFGQSNETYVPPKKDFADTR